MDAISQSEAYSTKYEATVVTGLEQQATEECREKLNPSNIDFKQGRIIFDTEKDVRNVLELRGVDNISILLWRKRLDNLPKDKDELEEILHASLDDSFWKPVLGVWKKVFGFDRCDVDTAVNCKQEDSEVKPRFRVTCTRNGNGHCFTSVEAACLYGAVLNEHFKWPVSMKNHDLEVEFDIKDDHLQVGVAITRKSLHCRNLIAFGPTSLRATICYNILRIANIQVGDIVCDPMCGSGAISVESAISWPQSFNIASEIHEKGIENTLANVKASEKHKIDIMRADATNFPFRNESIDVFIADLPFGKRLGSKHDNRTLYPAILKEMGRCSRLKTGKAILITSDKKNLITVLKNRVLQKYWIKNHTLYARIGNLSAAVTTFKRTHVKYE